MVKPMKGNLDTYNWWRWVACIQRIFSIQNEQMKNSKIYVTGQNSDINKEQKSN